MDGGEPLSVGVVGLGYWGPNLLRVLGDDPDVEIRRLCDREPERLSRCRRRHPLAQAGTDIAEVLDDDAVDAVVIATPVTSHGELVSAALNARKHVFVEKPLAASSAQADELVALADDVDRVLFCGHTFLYSPPVRAVRDMLEHATLGELFFVSCSRVNLGPYRHDVNVLWDLGPHDFSILRYWFGEPPTTVQAVGRDALTRGIADVAFVSLQFPGGVVAGVELSWLAPAKLRRTVVVGSDKMVVYEDGAPEPLRLFDRGIVLGSPEPCDPAYRRGDVLVPGLEEREPLRAELADFVRAVRHGDRLEAQTELAIDVVRIIEAADRSLRSDGTPVAVADATVQARLLRPRSAALERREPAA